MDIFGGILNAVDDFFYTPQEAAADEAKKLTAQAQIAQAQAQIAQAQAQNAQAGSVQTYLLYGLGAVAVLVVGVLAYKLIR